MKVDIVIGANYGDEGKGLFTEFLSETSDKSVVVLANGGCQRGHTVNDPKYGKHVFHHFGSGTLQGRPTYFASTYLLNPMQFCKEHDEIVALTRKAPIVYYDPNCYIQLPVDIALNWHIEKCRGEKRHGSVGCGIWESVYRSKYGIYTSLRNLTISKFCSLQHKDKLDIIRDISYNHAKNRCQELGVTDNIELLDIFLSKGFAEHFIADTLRMHMLCCADIDLKSFEHMIFENGQGLMLDQYYRSADLANTTPSYTGSIAIANMLQYDLDIDVSEVNLNYISRTYLTKHGAGEFKEECNEMYFEDSTNVWNEWQEGLRFGRLDYTALFDRIELDFNYFKKFCPKYAPIAKKNIVFTHVNEVELAGRFMSSNFTKFYSSTSDKAKDIILL